MDIQFLLEKLGYDKCFKGCPNFRSIGGLGRFNIFLFFPIEVYFITFLIS